MSKTSKNKDEQLHPFLPQGMLRFFALAAFLLVPWTVLLSQSLPSDHLAHHWNMAWIGFDCFLILTLAFTAILGLRKSGWVIVPATIACTLLLIDAWFDCLTAKQGWEYLISLSSAAFIEIPMAIMAFWIAYRAGRHYIKKK